jgi:hypothetical protein
MMFFLGLIMLVIGVGVFQKNYQRSVIHRFFLQCKKDKIRFVQLLNAICYEDFAHYDVLIDYFNFGGIYMLSDLELMEQHVKVLFQHNTENRVTVVNEPPYDVAPRIFLGGTKMGNVVRYSNTLDASLVEKLEKVIGTNHLGEVINVLSKDRQLNNLWIGPAYVFLDVRDRSCTNAIQVTHENKELLKPHFPYTFLDFKYKEPCFVIVEDNIVVSICCSSRQTSKAAEASVFTHKDYRGRAYGVEVTNAWAAEVQKQGRIALYSTSWDNFSSQSVARKLQLVQYGTDIHLS